MLTEAAIKAAKPRPKPYRMTDGHGLYLLVRPMALAGGAWTTADPVVIATR